MEPLQVTYDRVVAHLRQQGCQSHHPETFECLYRGPDGLMCAAGVLIPDDMYDEGMEYRPWGDLIVDFPQLQGLYDESLVTSLQAVHDRSSTAARWETEFQLTAKGYGLQYRPVAT